MHFTNLNEYDKIHKGDNMVLKEFEKYFGTEKQCLDYLYKLRWEFGYRCPKCQHNEMWKIKDYKYKCKKCGYQTTVISGTLFQDTHIPLNTWFRAIWYLSEQPNMTVDILQKELDLGSNRTALAIRNKIYLTKMHTGLTTLQGTVELGKYFMGFNNKGTWIAVAVEINNKKIGCIRLKEIENTTDGFHQFIIECIETGSTIISSEQIDFVRLSKKNYIKEVKSYAYTFPYAKKIISKLKKWLAEATCSNSLEASLNEFCVFFNRDKTKISFDEMVKGAISLHPVPNIKSKL